MYQAGRYHGHLRGGVVTEAKSGNPQVVLTFLVGHTWNGRDWQPIEGGERKVFLSLTDGAWQYTEAKLRTLGFTGDFVKPEFGDAAYTQGVELLCKHEDYNGSVMERWDLANWGDGTAEPAPENVLRNLNARWKSSSAMQAQVPAARAVTPPATSQTTTPAPSPTATTASPVSAPPAVGAPPPPAATAPRTCTKDEAWGVLCSTWESKKSREELTEAWRALVAEQANGRPESEFTAEDWGAIAAAAEVPF